MDHITTKEVKGQSTLILSQWLKPPSQLS